MKISEFKTEYKQLIEIFRKLDRKVIVIFLSVAVLQTVSWYHSSRNFFRIKFFPHYQNDPNIYLYEYLYWFASDFITLFILSILIIKFIIKEDLRDFGLQLGDYKAGLTFSTIFLGVMILIIWFISAIPDFASKYPHLQLTKNSWRDFYIYEAGMVLYMIGWEFIWRGFMLFGLKEKFGYYSVLIQMIPFVILHNGKPAPETFGAIAGGIALGMLAFRTKSIYYCIITHMGVMFSIDLISTLRYRANDYGIGVDSLFKIIINIF